MAKHIRLRSTNTRSIKFEHAMLDDAVPYTEEELDSLALDVLNGRKPPDDMVMALRSCLRHVIGRYLAGWPTLCEPYLDDMVGEGFLAISRFIQELTFDMVSECAILKIASTRIRTSIDVLLNTLQANVKAPDRTQRQLSADGKETIYLDSTSDTFPESAEPPDEGDIYKRDIMEALEQIEPKDRIDAVLLDPLYWGKLEEELAELLGVTQKTINKRKKRLYQEFLRLTR